jgi:hypothetical protein
MVAIDDLWWQSPGQHTYHCLYGEVFDNEDCDEGG